jgi:aminoglycoside 6'-N-acetyltransferase I
VIRTARPHDAPALCAFRCALWPDGSEAEHGEELEAFFRGEGREPLAVFVAEDGDGRPVGFCEVSIHPYAEGCRTDRVGYLEGWYVAPAARGGGVGRALVEAAEDWAREQGCTEFASDAAADNDLSRAAHEALGFTEAGLIRCFRKDL